MIGPPTKTRCRTIISPLGLVCGGLGLVCGGSGLVSTSAARFGDSHIAIIVDNIAKQMVS